MPLLGVMEPGQPEGMATGYFTRTTGTRIMKETFGIEGGQIFQADWEEVELENGTRGIFSRAIAEMDFRLDSQLDAFLLLGEANTNTAPYRYLLISVEVPLPFRLLMV